MFKNPPMCEVCGKNEAVSFSFFHREDCDYDGAGGKFMSMKPMTVGKLLELPKEIMETHSRHNDSVRELYNLKYECKFTCQCTEDTELYYIFIDKFFRSPEATTDWIAHMSEKVWFDFKDFCWMMKRLRASTSSYGKL